MSNYLRGSLRHIIQNSPSGMLFTAAEIGVADALNVKSWVALGDPFDFKEIVLIDNTDQLYHIECINKFVSNFPFARFLNMSSIEAAEKFPDEYFDFIYIDGDHSYLGVCADLATWQNKVKKGGFIAGHDYDVDPGFCVNRAVDGFAASKNTEVVKLHTEFVIKRTW